MRIAGTLSAQPPFSASGYRDPDRTSARPMRIASIRDAMLQTSAYCLIESDRIPAARVPTAEVLHPRIMSVRHFSASPYHEHDRMAVSGMRIADTRPVLRQANAYEPPDSDSMNVRPMRIACTWGAIPQIGALHYQAHDRMNARLMRIAHIKPVTLHSNVSRSHEPGPILARWMRIAHIKPVTRIVNAPRSHEHERTPAMRIPSAETALSMIRSAEMESSSARTNHDSMRNVIRSMVRDHRQTPILGAMPTARSKHDEAEESRSTSSPGLRRFLDEDLRYA